MCVVKPIGHVIAQTACTVYRLNAYKSPRLVVVSYFRLSFSLFLTSKWPVRRHQGSVIRLCRHISTADDRSTFRHRAYRLLSWLQCQDHAHCAVRSGAVTAIRRYRTTSVMNRNDEEGTARLISSLLLLSRFSCSYRLVTVWHTLHSRVRLWELAGVQ